jgi:hypothetical protein
MNNGVLSGATGLTGMAWQQGREAAGLAGHIMPMGIESEQLVSEPSQPDRVTRPETKSAGAGPGRGRLRAR